MPKAKLTPEQRIERNRAAYRRHYLLHKEEVKAKRMARYYADPDKENEAKRAKRLTDLEAARAADRAYYWAHKEKLDEYHRNWQRENKDRIRQNRNKKAGVK